MLAGFGGIGDEEVDGDLIGRPLSIFSCLFSRLRSCFCMFRLCCFTSRNSSRTRERILSIISSFLPLAGSLARLMPGRRSDEERESSRLLRESAEIGDVGEEDREGDEDGEEEDESELTDDCCDENLLGGAFDDIIEEYLVAVPLTENLENVACWGACVGRSCEGFESL